MRTFQGRTAGNTGTGNEPEGGRKGRSRWRGGRKGREKIEKKSQF